MDNERVSGRPASVGGIAVWLLAALLLPTQLLAGQTFGAPPSVPQNAPFAPQQQLEIPQVPSAPRYPPQSSPEPRENTELGSKLSAYLHSHRLPYVDAHVYGENDSSRRVVLTGSVATQLGHSDAEERTREFLATPQVTIVNQVTVNPDVRAHPPDRFLSEGNTAEILPRTFQGCWQGTVAQPDYDRSIPPFTMGDWMSETYRLCYVRHGDGPFELTFSSLSMDPTAAETEGIHIDDFRGKVEVVSNDGADRATLRARMHFRQKQSVLLGLLSQQSVSEAIVNMQCRLTNGAMQVQAQFLQTCDGRPCFEGRWHQTFYKSSD